MLKFYKLKIKYLKSKGFFDEVTIKFMSYRNTERDTEAATGGVL